MACVITIFVICLLFNVFLNSFDVYSDITLTFKTLTFNLGKTFLLTGCHICHGKENKDVYYTRNNSCHQCLSRNSEFMCGNSYEILNKLNELENSKTCKDDHLNFSYNATSKDYSGYSH